MHTSGFGAPATVYLPDAAAPAFAYAELGRARASRGLEELLAPTSIGGLPSEGRNR